MKISKHLSIFALALTAFAAPVAAQNVKPYAQFDLGAASPSGQLGEQLIFGGRVGAEVNKWVGGDLALTQGFMTPATNLGAANSTEFKLTPVVKASLDKSVEIFGGPLIGVALMSGPATTNNMVGLYGAALGVKINTGYQNWSIVPSYEYTRSMTPAVITGPGYVDYYNNNKFMLGLRKSF